jgi:uncharacterized membrane protein YccC
LERESVAPFENIENAQEYLSLLAQAVDESRQMVQDDLKAQQDSGSPRPVEALRLILYNLEKLAQHVKISRRILNDLRTLRRLLHQERAEKVAQTDTAA